jgi:nucleoside-diphosphate-sugar epimerase
MRVFVAGGAGVLGRRLVPQLVARGHQVTATTTSAAKLDLLARLGADGVVMDGLDAVSVGEAVAKARPDAIVHQMTGISLTHAGKPDLKHFDRWAIPTIRLRTEGTDHLLAAAEATGVSHFVAQGYANWNGIRQGGWVKTEEDPLDLHEGTAAHTSMAALRHVEDVVGKAGGAVMRYGGFYGPGATDDQVELVRKRQFPLVGSGAGYASWVHLDDAASATVLAVEQQARGVFNIVDDEPAPASEWLPYLAECAGAKRPMRVPTWLARLLAGEVAVVMMTEGRGFSNAKAKRELGGRPASGGRSTSGRGSPSRCWPTPTRTRSGRRSWPTRCRWRPCCCWSGSPRSSARSSCCGRCSPQLPGDRIGGGEIGGGVPPARGAGAPPHGRGPAPVRGRPQRARGTRRTILRRLPGRGRRRAAGAAGRRRSHGR